MNFSARLLKSLRRRLQIRSPHNIKKQRRLLRVEALEDRRLMAIYVMRSESTSPWINDWAESNNLVALIWRDRNQDPSSIPDGWLPGAHASITNPSGTLTINSNTSVGSNPTSIQAASLTVNSKEPGQTTTVTIARNASDSTRTLILAGTQASGEPAVGSIDAGSGATINITAPVEGSNGLTKNGLGTLVLAGVNTYSGSTAVNLGTMLVNGSISTSTTVNAGAVLGGTGTIDGAITVQSGGTLSPGLVNATGILNTANVTFSNSGSTFSVAVNSSTAGTGYDQLKVVGTVALGNATLSTSGSIATGPGNTAIVLIDNDGSDAVSGTFNGLAEGSTVVINGISFGISYRGGDGNDVTLNHLAQPVLTITSADRVYNGTVYTATASISGNNTPIPTLSYTYYSDSTGTSIIPAPTNAGTYHVRASSAANAGNLAALSPLKTFQITRKSLSITNPTINSRNYDGTTNAGPVSVGTLSEFVGAETVTVTGSAAAYPSANVGSYSTTVSYILGNGNNGGLASNYSLANGTATGTITPKALSITPPSIASRTYDRTNTAGTLTIGTLSEFVGAETVTVTGSAAAYPSANVGSYSTTVSYILGNGNNGGLASNYLLANGTATGSVTARTLNITADAKSKFVGQTDPAFTFQQSGLLTGDELTGVLNRQLGEGPGSYAIVIGTLTAGPNYAINYTGANLTITAITLSSVAVNGGVPFANPAQRSMITSLDVTFNTPVTLDPNAFSLENIGLFSASSRFIPQNQLMITPSTGSSSVFTITFDAGSVANGTTLNGVTKRAGGATASTTGNSLDDGNYVLRIDSTKVRSGSGTLTGNSTFGATATDNFFRMYGDSNGDGRVDGTDFNRLKVALGKDNPIFDFDGDGVVSSATNGVDFTEYQRRHNRRRRVGY